jgi:N,N'-diacetyllegionaminate synthase
VSTYVIAEAGACGDADLSKMLQQVKFAKSAGADAVKFQWTSNSEKMSTNRGSIGAFSYASIYERYIQWPKEWHSVLHESSREIGLDYMCTVYLPEDIQVVEPFVSSFKVASFEMTDDRFIRAHAEYLSTSDEREIFISTGMSTTESLERLASKVLCHLPEKRWRLMHCVSAYPSPIGELNLRCIYSSWFTDAPLTGFSDHTAPELFGTGGIAAAAGASVIEAHMKLDTTSKKNPDEAHAMTPDQFGRYVQFIRQTEVVLGSELKRQQECERGMMKYQVT